MSKKVRIPTPLRKLTQNEEIVEIQAATVGGAIEELQARYPGIGERLIDEKGEVRRFVNVYVNEEDIRFLKNRETPLKDGDEISIIPAIAGGEGATRRGKAPPGAQPPGFPGNGGGRFNELAASRAHPAGDAGMQNKPNLCQQERKSRKTSRTVRSSSACG